MREPGGGVATRAGCAVLSIVFGLVVLSGSPVAGQDDLDSLLMEEPSSAAESTAEPAAAAPDTTPEPTPAPRVEAPPPAPPGDAGAEVADGEPEATPAPRVEAQSVPAPADAAAEPVLRRPVDHRIEEIVVTAQKREEAIQDVPIAMTVLTDEFIAREGLTDLRDIAAFVPNVRLQESGFVIRPRIRGFSLEDDNPAFDPPVTLALDGIPYTRLPYFQAALLDVNRVEALRGPQGTTFGKNTTAGLVSVLSKDPTDELSGFVDVQIGELDRRRFEGAVGGPLVTDVVQFRIAGLSDERDGYIRNTTAAISPETAPRFLGRDRKVVRAKLRFPDLVGSDFKVSYERFALDSLGSGGELFDVSEAIQSFLRDFDPNADFIRKNGVNSVDQRDTRETTIESFVADWGTEIGSWGLNALAGYSELESRAIVDADFTPVRAIFADFTETSPTTTFELRTTSPTYPGLFGLERLFGVGLGSTEFLAGVFYQNRQIDPTVTFLQIYEAATSALIALDQAEQNGTPPPPDLPGPSDLATDTVEELLITFTQDADTYAGFFQLWWYPLEKWTLQTGMRFSHETKEGFWENRFLSEERAILTAGQYQEFTTTDSISEFQIQPKVSLNYKPIEDVSLFASWARGFKGGGFNAAARGPSEDELRFADEAVTQWAIDAKTTLLDGTASLNVALFRMELDDFQVLTTETTGDIVQIFQITRVLNAAEAVSQGVEVDLTWFPTEWGSLMASLGFNDTEYLEFPDGPCAAGRANTDGDENPRCDLSGEPLGFAPKWDVAISPGVRWPLAGILGGAFQGLAGIDLTLGVTIEYEDTQFIDDSIDPRKRQGSHFLFKANVGIENLAQGWSARLIGENLSNERIAVEEGSISGAPNTFVGLREPPRLLFGQVRFSF